MNSRRAPQDASPRAFALPMVLIFTAGITILIVGLFLSLTRERGASNSMGENDRAKITAQNALEHAAALLENIPQPKPPKAGPLGASIDAVENVNWITSPGLLTLVRGENSVTEIPLSTNPSAGYVPTSADANLNLPLLEPDAEGNAVYPILPPSGGGAQPLRVAWVNLLADPSQPASKSNPLVARYAFWIDDETTKLNLNTARGKPASPALDLAKPNPLVTDPLAGFSGPTSGSRAANPVKVLARATSGGNAPGANGNLTVNYPLWHPSALNLDVLDLPGAVLRKDLDDDAGNAQGNLATKVHNAYFLGGGDYEFRWRPLSSVREISTLIDGDAEKYLAENTFHLTTSGRSPEFNVFGKSRLFMERQLPVLDNSLYHQMDYDRDGPMLTHAGEVKGGRTGQGGGFNGGFWYPNYTGFADAAWSIAHALTRRDWPGMPRSSFVDKWSSGYTEEQALREADQVAWNMVMLAAYSSGDERTNGAGNLTEGTEALSVMLKNYVHRGLDPIYGVGAANHVSNTRGLPNANRYLFPGKLSGKAILPWKPSPLINEIALCVEAVDVSDIIDPTDTKYCLRMWVEVDVNMGGQAALMPTVRSATGRWAYDFRLTNFELEVRQEGSLIANQRIPGPDTTTSVYARSSGDLISPDAASHLYSGEIYTISGVPFLVNKTGDGYATAITANNSAFFDKASPIEINARLRLCLAQGTNASAPDSLLQLIPVWDRDEGSSYFEPPPGEDDRLTITMASFNPYDIGEIYRRSLEISDPRLGGNSSAWRPFIKPDTLLAPDPSDPEGAAPGMRNASETMSPGDQSKYAYHDLLNASYRNVFPRGSIGMLSVVPTGMQRGIPNQTLKFQPSGGAGDELPDWLVLDLFAPALRPFAYMHSVSGKINPNAALTPDSNAERWKPLQALLENMPYAGTGGAPSNLVRNILEYRFAGRDYGAPGRYDYIGEVCEVEGFAEAGSTDWEREALVRNLANLLTTRSNSFTVHGVAQIVRKRPGATNWGVFEKGDQITGEKRFRSAIERGVWPGTDGTLGNASTNEAGQYTKTAQPRGEPDYDKKDSASRGRWIGDTPWAPLPTPIFGDKPNYPISGAAWPVVDGPEAPTLKPTSKWPGAPTDGPDLWGQVVHEDTPLEEAANPIRAWMRLNVTNFDYLDQ